MFTPFHKPPYPNLYGRSVDETTTILSSIVPHKTSSGARPTLPMGVALEAIVEKLISSIGSKKMCRLSCYENITQ
jgi:hypothetical protein